MIAYTTYLTDARVRREAETIASLPDYRVSVFVLKEHAEANTYILDGVEVVELNVAKYRGKNTMKYLVSYIVFLMHAFLKCTGKYMSNTLDLVHVHNMPNFLVFAAIIPRLFGIKVILDIHDILIETYASKFNGFSNRLFKYGLHVEEWICCKLASRIICTNHLQYQTLVDRGIAVKKLMVLMNLPDPAKFCMNGEKRNPMNQRGFRLVYFGTITKRLGIDLAIRAVNEIRAKIPGLQFYIYGSGEDRDEFLELSRQLNLDAIVHFSEHAVPLEEIISIVKSMDLVIVPNRKNVATEQMLPVKMLEGLALGIPVVVPRLKPIEYYFTGEQVFFFEPENVQSLAMTIAQAYQDRIGRDDKMKNAKKFFEKYAWETHKLDLIGLYRSLSTEKRPPLRKLLP